MHKTPILKDIQMLRVLSSQTARRNLAILSILSRKRLYVLSRGIVEVLPFWQKTKRQAKDSVKCRLLMPVTKSDMTCDF